MESCQLAVTNITASARLNTDLDLDQLARNMFDVEYNTKKFSALIHRLRTPKATCMVSGNGHIICVGTQTIDDAKRALSKTRRHLAWAARNSNVNTKTEKPPFKLTHFRVHNIASHYKHNKSFRLDALARMYPNSTIYDTSVFSGLRFGDLGGGNKIRAVIYHSGSILLTGAQTHAALHEAFELLKERLEINQPTNTTTEK